MAQHREKRQLVAKSVRVTPECDFMWDMLADHTGLSLVGVLETAIRRMARAEGILGEGKPVERPQIETDGSPDKAE